MNKDDVIGIIRQHNAELAIAYGVASISLFGSVLHGETHAGSDIDLLVEFPVPPTFDQYMGLKLALEDLLGGPVDLVTRRGLKDRLRRVIESEALRVA